MIDHPPNTDSRTDLEDQVNTTLIQVRELRIAGTCKDVVAIHRNMTSEAFISCSQLKRLELSFGHLSGAAAIINSYASVEEMIVDFRKYST
ncbi:hypothetical protein AN958_07539 [Leucoagaricus sp. SymC.cos]|nr:hypothetical protein AN958_07539 [Leucoagaricus sp. SymC.cos]